MYSRIRPASSSKSTSVLQYIPHTFFLGTCGRDTAKKFLRAHFPHPAPSGFRKQCIARDKAEWASRGPTSPSGRRERDRRSPRRSLVLRHGWVPELSTRQFRRIRRWGPEAKLGPSDVSQHGPAPLLTLDHRRSNFRRCCAGIAIFGPCWPKRSRKAQNENHRNFYYDKYNGVLVPFLQIFVTPN